MDLTISIVNWNTRDLLDQCLQSVWKNAEGLDVEVVVVDNASSDGSADMVRGKHPQARLIENPDNLGFAAANNQAYEVSESAYFLLLNPDTVCLEGALAGLVRFLDDHPDAGAVGPLVLNADGTLQPSWARFPTFWNELRGRLDRRIACKGNWPDTADSVRALGPSQADWVGGCCLMIRREAVQQIGLMDESLFMYCEETDWCLRLRENGWGVWLQPTSEIVHLGGQSSGQAAAESSRHLRASKGRYFRKHHGLVAGAMLEIALALKARAKAALSGFWTIRE